MNHVNEIKQAGHSLSPALYLTPKGIEMNSNQKLYKIVFVHQYAVDEARFFARAFKAQITEQIYEKQFASLKDEIKSCNPGINKELAFDEVLTYLGDKGKWIMANRSGSEYEEKMKILLKKFLIILYKEGQYLIVVKDDFDDSLSYTVCDSEDEWNETIQKMYEAPVVGGAA